ncbi:hypothetical protein M404DRAFT_958459 [Pisolithus tinctorius Marx 270]|uniref:Uncharacterized protein n=1 Tax=Pisolithus tinctorius Marx 270 TaxID=870435 RepID=A0A0C3JTE3_PISTI|nr:hypothetical protein M404DRAFT_958459 [Pisolithus tinctorius Marx 270]
MYSRDGAVNTYHFFCNENVKLLCAEGALDNMCYNVLTHSLLLRLSIYHPEQTRPLAVRGDYMLVFCGIGRSCARSYSFRRRPRVLTRRQ